MAFFAGIRQDESGVAAIEFALLAPLLVLFLVGTIEVGTAAYRAMQVQAAAEAGAYYASINRFDSEGIANAVSGANHPRITATPAPSLFRACPSSTGLTEQACSSTCVCPDGSQPGQYVRISSQMILDPPILEGLGIPRTLTGEAVVRIY